MNAAVRNWSISNGGGIFIDHESLTGSVSVTDAHITGMGSTGIIALNVAFLTIRGGLIANNVARNGGALHLYV